MEENSFEKQVQQKMDEIKIQPSDCVWNKVEIRIKKNERSRRGLILLFCLLFIFLTGSYLLWNSMRRSNPVNNNYTGINSEKNNNKQDDGKTLLKVDSTILLKNKTPKNLTDKNIDSGNTASARASLNSITYHRKISTRRRTSIAINFGENIIDKNSKEQKKEKQVRADTGHQTVFDEPLEIETNNKNNDSVVTFFIKKSQTDTLLKIVLQNEVMKKQDSSNSTPAVITAKKSSTKNKWKTGFSFSAGVSNVEAGFLKGDNLYYSYQANSVTSNANQGAGSYPANLKSSFGFIAGVFKEKNISPGAVLAIGINFTSFSINNKIGKRNDTSGLYTSQNATNNYHVNYNFIGLPVTLKFKIGKSNRVPIYWQAGVVFSELLSTNALQFNNSSVYYYHDNSLFNKSQVALNTAIYAKIFSKRKNAVLIGPYFFYSTSKVANEGLYNKSHFVFAGLRTEIILNK